MRVLVGRVSGGKAPKRKPAPSKPTPSKPAPSNSVEAAQRGAESTPSEDSDGAPTSAPAPGSLPGAGGGCGRRVGGAKRRRKEASDSGEATSGDPQGELGPESGATGAGARLGGDVAGAEAPPAAPDVRAASHVSPRQYFLSAEP